MSYVHTHTYRFCFPGDPWLIHRPIRGGLPKGRVVREQCLLFHSGKAWESRGWQTIEASGDGSPADLFSLSSVWPGSGLRLDTTMCSAIHITPLSPSISQSPAFRLSTVTPLSTASVTFHNHPSLTCLAPASLGQCFCPLSPAPASCTLSIAPAPLHPSPIPSPLHQCHQCPIAQPIARHVCTCCFLSLECSLTPPLLVKTYFSSITQLTFSSSRKPSLASLPRLSLHCLPSLYSTWHDSKFYQLQLVLSQFLIIFSTLLFHGSFWQFGKTRILLSSAWYKIQKITKKLAFQYNELSKYFLKCCMLTDVLSY